MRRIRLLCLLFGIFAILPGEFYLSRFDNRPEASYLPDIMVPSIDGQLMTSLVENSRWHLALVVVVCLASVTLLVTRLHYGFLAHDDSGWSYLAERTLHGELPNVDFCDDYTGGLSYLNALALRLFGVRLISPRIMLLLFFVPWIPTVWYLASRITSSLNAILATLLAAVWSVPVYPAPFGSWYNLYFATFGTAALFRYLDTGHRRWIFWAGVCGGLSFLAKIFGLYFVAAAGLFLVFDEQNENAGSDIRSKVSWSVYSIFITLTLLAFTGALIKLINSAGRSAGSMNFLAPSYHFVLPGAAVSLLLIHREWSTPRVSARARLLSLGSRVGLFSLGIIVPVAIFFVPYVQRHALAKWCASVLLSGRRLQHATLPVSNWFALLCVPLLLVLLANTECKHPRTRAVTTAVLSIVLGLLLLAAPGHSLVSGAVWFSIAESLPIVVVIGVIVLSRKRPAGSRLTQRLMLLLFVAATSSLVQFPSAAPIYFFSVVPVLILVVLALAEETTAYRHWHSPLLPVLAFYVLFGMFAILPGTFYLSWFDNRPEAAFTLPVAAGFIGEKDTVELYERAVPEVLRHAGNAPIYAGPDSPGFYFLTGHRNPTPIYFDFVAGADAQPERILNAIDNGGVRTVVINHGGALGYNPSGPPSTKLLDGLRERFPKSTVIGYFEIRWKS